MPNNTIQTKSFEFALAIISLYGKEFKMEVPRETNL